MLLTKDVYHLSSRFPADERFGLTSQIRRAAVSIPSNIAEGCGRSSDKEFARFLEIASASINETETQILLAKDLFEYQGFKLNDFDNILEKSSELSRMIYALSLKLKANS